MHFDSGGEEMDILELQNNYIHELSSMTRIQWYNHYFTLYDCIWDMCDYSFLDIFISNDSLSIENFDARDDPLANSIEKTEIYFVYRETWSSTCWPTRSATCRRICSATRSNPVSSSSNSLRILRVQGVQCASTSRVCHRRCRLRPRRRLRCRRPRSNHRCLWRDHRPRVIFPPQRGPVSNHPKIYLY